VGAGMCVRGCTWVRVCVEGGARGCGYVLKGVHVGAGMC